MSDFDYDLPRELIAQEPLARRDASRMLIVDRRSGSFQDSTFLDLTSFLKPDDVIVLNNTKVFPARLFGKSETGANIEIFLIRETRNNVWEALARPGRRLRIGKTINFGAKLTARTLEKTEDGKVLIRFETGDNLYEILDEIGKTPLPPYIKRENIRIDTDRERYQTVFARKRGAIAAPTAGLHFTPGVLDSIRQLGVTIAEITLHVGYGTFEPVRVVDLVNHRVSPESYEIDQKAAEILNRARTDSRRIVAIGTTTTRALENTISRLPAFTRPI